MAIMSLILFDYDGVLADTLDDLISIGQAVCNELGVKHTVTQHDLNVLEVMSFSTYGKQLGVPDSLVDEFVRRCLDRFAQKESPPEIFDGLADVIRELSASHVLGIVTTNSTLNVNLFLVKHGLEDCFRVIHGVDTPGTKAEKISLAKKQFAAKNKPVFMIGDSLSDIRAAREASVISIAVAWGHQTLERLQSENPDVVVHTPLELKTVIARLNKSSYKIQVADPQGVDALMLLHEAALEARSLYPELFTDPNSSPPTNPPTHPRGIYLLVYDDAKPIGSGALCSMDEATVEIRRMYVLKEYRHHGVARMILEALEEEAVRFGYSSMRLETGYKQIAAMRLYESFGFTRIPPFGPYVDDPTSVCFEKAVQNSEPDSNH